MKGVVVSGLERAGWSEESLRWMSPRLCRVVGLLGDRMAAACGVRTVGGYDEGQVAPDGPSSPEVLRRVLGDLLEVEDLEPALEYLARRVMHIGRLLGLPEGMLPTLLSEAGQMVGLGLLFAREGKVPASRVGLTPLEASGPGGPAFESFKSAVERVRPPHGGFPGEVC